MIYSSSVRQFKRLNQSVVAIRKIIGSFNYSSCGKMMFRATSNVNLWIV